MKTLTVLLALLLTQTAWAAAPSTLRIGYQKGSIALVLAKEHGLLLLEGDALAAMLLKSKSGKA